MDQTNVNKCFSTTFYNLWYCIFDKFYCYLLSRSKSNSIHFNGMQIISIVLNLFKNSLIKFILFFSKLAVMCICFFIILPLTLVGTLLGRNLNGQANYPCRVSSVPRPIPDVKFFMKPSIIVTLGGILPVRNLPSDFDVKINELFFYSLVVFS